MPRQEWVGIEPMGEVFLLTFLFIGLVREADYTLKWIAAAKFAQMALLDPAAFPITSP
jgi:hypothetical protein